MQKNPQEIADQKHLDYCRSVNIPEHAAEGCTCYLAFDRMCFCGRDATHTVEGSYCTHWGYCQYVCESEMCAALALQGADRRRVSDIRIVSIV